jgi:hypothetical protein
VSPFRECRLALPANLGLRHEGFSGTNILAYLVLAFSVTPESNYIKNIVH